MKKQILKGVLLGIMAMTGLQNVAIAGGYPSISLEEFKSVEPVYIMITAEAENCLNDFYLIACLVDLKNNTVNHDQVSFKGEITLKGAKMTVAKELLLVTEDKLTSSSGDLGVPADKLEFDFNTEFYKGFILKIYLDEGSVNKIDDQPVLNYKVLANGQEIEQSVTMGFAVSGQSFGNQNGPGEINGTILPYKFGSTLDERNTEFKKRLNIGSKLLGVERWARGKYLNGEIDANLLIAVMELSKSSWTKSYPEEFNTKFNRRFSQLKFMSDRDMISPLRLYGALNTLMKTNR
jgi:hypothetical protein